MTMHSTSKMLASMLENKRSESENKVDKDSLDLFDTPQLHPSPDMELTLTNILGASLGKNCTPMD